MDCRVGDLARSPAATDTWCDAVTRSGASASFLQPIDGLDMGHAGGAARASAGAFIGALSSSSGRKTRSHHGRALTGARKRPWPRRVPRHRETASRPIGASPAGQRVHLVGLALSVISAMDQRAPGSETLPPRVTVL